MLKLLNTLARAIQSRSGGIPAPGAYLYRLVACRVLKRFHRVVAEELSKTVSHGPVLDVGCGTASLIRELARLTKPPRGFVGLDLSIAMARIALEEVRREGLGAWIDIVVGDAHALPLRSQSVEIVVSTGTLHHLSKPSRFFNDCARVAKKVCKVYEFSHDVPREELIETSRMLSVPPPILRIISTLHGIPRREFIEGSIAQQLKFLNLKFKTFFRGPITVLEIVA